MHPLFTRLRVLWRRARCTPCQVLSVGRPAPNTNSAGYTERCCVVASFVFLLFPSAVRFPLPVIPPIRACTLSLWDYIYLIRCIAMSAPLTYANRRFHRVPCPGILLTHQEHSEREARSLFYLYVGTSMRRAREHRHQAHALADIIIYPISV